MIINVLIWQEHRHEKIIGLVQSLCCEDMEGALKKAITDYRDFMVESLRFDDDAEHGHSPKCLRECKVV